MNRSIGPMLRTQWNFTCKKPGGRWLFSKLLGRVVPYTGSIGAIVEVLEPGHSVISLKDRHRVRNHLHSIHAIALCNLGEMATGLALMNSLPDNTRGILAGLTIEYLKKARGHLMAECHCEIPDNNGEREYLLKGMIRDQENDLVAEVSARWLIGPET